MQKTLDTLCVMMRDLMIPDKYNEAIEGAIKAVEGWKYVKARLDYLESQPFPNEDAEYRRLKEFYTDYYLGENK